MDWLKHYNNARTVYCCIWGKELVVIGGMGKGVVCLWWQGRREALLELINCPQGKQCVFVCTCPDPVWVCSWAVNPTCPARLVCVCVCVCDLSGYSVVSVHGIQQIFGKKQNIWYFEKKGQCLVDLILQREDHIMVWRIMQIELVRHLVDLVNLTYWE